MGDRLVLPSSAAVHLLDAELTSVARRPTASRADPSRSRGAPLPNAYLLIALTRAGKQ